jgi:glutaredoxin
MEVVVYGRSNPPCGYCDNIKELLTRKSVTYTYKDISDEIYFEEFLTHRLKTVPALFIDGEFKGGFTEAVNVFKEKV